jgi:FlaA1/EpsC-like NDP-sugar epimerase
VIGAGRDLLRIVQRYSRLRVQIDEVLIAMPSATGREMNQALANCRSAGVPCRTLPSVSSLLEGKALHRQVREVSVEDLLGRDRVRLDEATIRRSLANRVVLITGAAGSIGSELCRQIAAFGPKKLVLFDKAESDVHRIDLELRAAFPSVLVAPVIGDIRIPRRIENTLSRHRVEVIFHAAAYKHVPLMELNVAEAVENNVLGTWNVARAAIGGGVKSFVMISSDKAVNPANVMGATKRAAELLVSSLPSGDESTTKFVSVRFGNVLGSSGSVVPIFQRQIAGGGPVTVTHPEIRRYFMLIPEAAQLVLQASTMGHGSEVYVLEMGELVKIADLARNMIRLAGLKPDEDIEIRYTGLRPGEKLYEELITEGENILPTQHEKIKVFQGPAPDPLLIRRWLEKVKRLVGEDDEAGLVLALKELVPEYQISDVWNERLPVSRAKSAAATV